MAELHSDGNYIESSILLQEYGLLVGDRAHLPNHPALAAGYLGSGSESATVTKTLSDIGSAVASTISEDGAVTPTAFSPTTVSATVVRKGYGRSRSDFLKTYDRTGMFLEQALAFDAAMIMGNTFMSMVAEAAATGSTGVAVTSGTSLTWAKFQEAKQTLIQTGQDFADGELLCILHPKQWSNLETQLAAGTSLSNAVLQTPEGYNMQYARSIGYQGRYFGIDVFTSTRVATANSGADSKGALIAPGGIVWADGLLEDDPDGFMDIVDGGRLRIERQRDASRAIKSYYYNFLKGVSLGESDRVVTILSDR